MVFRIVIAGELHCELFAQVCLVADHLSKNLPSFCYERIGKSVAEWKVWLHKTNVANKWNHYKSPLIWKELLMKGSKPYYIGSAPEFWDYCFSFYHFDSLLSLKKIESLVGNNLQFQNKVDAEKKHMLNLKTVDDILTDPPKDNNIAICISGAEHRLTTYIVSYLLNISKPDKKISRIYLYDGGPTTQFMKNLELECNYVETSLPHKIVKYIDKIEDILNHTDLLIMLDHIKFDEELAIGNWLHENKQMMRNLAYKINASASHRLKILLANLGPACYNATCLVEVLTTTIKNNVVVATSDLGLEVVHEAAKIAEVPLKNIYCPPVWGFVGINHIVDIRNTVHKYYRFEPYDRYKKVMKSTLQIGSLTPEIRTLGYLLHRDETLWTRIVEKKKMIVPTLQPLNKALAVINVVKPWLFSSNSNDVVSIGLLCDGSFGLHFKGIFSQPARLKNGFWTPAYDYMLPKDPHLKLDHLDKMAKIIFDLKSEALPKIFLSCPMNFKSKKKRQIQNDYSVVRFGPGHVEEFENKNETKL